MVIMWPKKSPPADNQLWYLDDNGIIRSKLTDFCLQPSGMLAELSGNLNIILSATYLYVVYCKPGYVVSNYFCFYFSGHGIWLQPFTKQANQMWMPQGKKIVLQNNPGVCLDIYGEDKKDGAKLCQFKYKGSANQHWKLVYIN